MSSWTLIRPWDTLSAMYSKCMVSPFMRTPIAIMASKGAVALVSAGGEVRSRAEVEPRRSVAERGEEWEDWIWEAEKSLRRDMLARGGRGVLVGRRDWKVVWARGEEVKIEREM